MAAENMKLIDSSTVFTLRWYQEEAINALYNFILQEDGHPVAAVPTGAGKTAIICGLIKRLLSDSKNIKILILSHIQEILEQDHEAIIKQLQIIPGLYSSGMGFKDIRNITVAGIQSVYRKVDLFSEFDIIIIDEAHLIPLNEKSMYRTFLSQIEDATYVGLTGTNFRAGTGYIHEGEDALFTHLVYDLTSVTNFNKLTDEGYLSPLITKPTLEILNTTGIRTVGDDFNRKDLSDKFDVAKITVPIVDEIIKFGKNYKRWLIFAIDIKHAEHISTLLRERNINTACIHSKMKEDREEIIEDIKNGKYRAVVNVDVLTTGFDDPAIDLIAMVRHTKSPIVHVQTAGRGLRVFPGKTHCLVLDFAGNTERLGPINDVKVEVKGKSKGGGEPITKRCPECTVIHHPSVRVCNVCGYEFQFKHNLSIESSNEKIVELEKSATEKHKISQSEKTSDNAEWFDVSEVYYSIHKKHGSPSSMKVTYVCDGGLKQVTEWICIDHRGFPKAKADAWVRHRWPINCNNRPPENLAELLSYSSLLNKPTRIFVKKDIRFDCIMNSIF